MLDLLVKILHWEKKFSSSKTRVFSEKNPESFKTEYQIIALRELGPKNKLLGAYSDRHQKEVVRQTNWMQLVINQNVFEAGQEHLSKENASESVEEGSQIRTSKT